MTYEEYLFVQLMEECAEIAKCASKRLRFGPDDCEPGQDQANIHRLRHEINDLLCVVEILETDELLPEVNDSDLRLAFKNKIAKMEKFVDYSRTLGRIV